MIPMARALTNVIWSLKHIVGQDNTQKIESKHINLRTRIKQLAHWPVCFSKTERMHHLAIGLFINRYEFGRVF